MKKFALYPGCVMPTEQYSYELSLREILPKLGIELVDLEGFSCCGEPLKSVNQLLTLSLAARNIAIAEKQGLDVFAPCPMCHLAMSECKRVLDADETIVYIGSSEFLEIAVNQRNASEIFNVRVGDLIEVSLFEEQK